MADMDTTQRLLVLIGSEPTQARVVASSVSKVGWRAICAPDIGQALTILNGMEGHVISAAVLDGWSGSQAGAEAIGLLGAVNPDLPVVVLSSGSEVLHAVEAMRAGATDYLVRPFSPDRLLGALRMITSIGSQSRELQSLSATFDFPLGFEAMIGTDGGFRAALARAALAARGHGHVLIEGEGGTGRTMLLRALHAASHRVNEPFKIVNMRSYTENALTSVLFGHEKGAFPGAFNRHVGALQYCHGGTLVLQEVNRMPASVQQRLAAAIQEQRVRPLGAGHSFDMDVQILSTSNQPLSDLIVEGRFETDLYKALTAICFEMPPLRSRTGDIPALSHSFVAALGDHARGRELTISNDAYNLLRSYEWPGNIRQLQSVLIRAAARCDGDALTADHLPELLEIATPASPEQSMPRRMPEQVGVAIYGIDGNLRPLEQIEADVIRLAIAHYSGRMTEVARRLRIGRSTLYRKLHEFEIEPMPNRGHP
ncbi:sigma-54 dependent transcriptional regulator [Novosphingobium sp. 9U]|uniref:sigma-54-dependent transcriptional regulator n=1 Tax=Novosphingobium sp. 9U TaxID=2653158 RepID=UPI0012EFF4DC|nr:sigma-54 dependent transcriptional regulator [Novosphingobium sp. 9U]VWX52750.1 Sigma-54-dependent Fis family transcriptional regulator [Novosphingobium sp. 9U]